jgi:hypothetical protein
VGWVSNTQGSRPGLSYFAATRLRCCSGMPARADEPGCALVAAPEGGAALHYALQTQYSQTSQNDVCARRWPVWAGKWRNR